jgi:hypothetical protein
MVGINHFFLGRACGFLAAFSAKLLLRHAPNAHRRIQFETAIQGK